MTLELPVFRPSRRLLLPAGALTVLGGVLLFVGALVNPRQFYFSYLTAYTYAETTIAGALFFLMTVHTMGAVWPVAVRRLVEAMAGLFPAIAILFLPIVPGLRSLYPWTEPNRQTDPHLTHLLEHKEQYLNVPFFLVRAAAFLAFLGIVSWMLCRWSTEQDETTSVLSPPYKKLSALMLPPTALVFTFAGFDWVMSLTPAWYSTMYGVYLFGSGFVTSIALLTVLMYFAQKSGLVVLDTSHYYAVGRLLLSFVIFWAYIAFFQYMLIWIANKPEEIAYYKTRIDGSWRYFSIALVVLQFAVPFVLLLSYDLKFRPRALTAVAILLLFAHWVDSHWLVAPAAHPEGVAVHWLDLAAMAFLGGVLVLIGSLRLRGKPLAPVRDPDLAQALEYRSS